MPLYRCTIKISLQGWILFTLKTIFLVGVLPWFTLNIHWPKLIGIYQLGINCRNVNFGREIALVMDDKS